MIFLIEDNENLREAVASYLRLNDYEVVEFGRVAGVLEALETREPDLIILDVMLPDGNGFHLARKIRSNHQMPIVFLTAKSSESDRIAGFEVGGDDYVVKPFSPKELTLRVEAILRRTRAGTTADEDMSRWIFDDHILELDKAAHRVTLDGREVNLTAAEWNILLRLSASAGVVISRERLLGGGLDYLSAQGSERTIDTHIKNLRVKLGSPSWIETVYSFGYRFSGKAG